MNAAPFGMQSARRVSNILLSTESDPHSLTNFTGRTGSMRPPVTRVTVFADYEDGGLTSSFAEGPP